MSTGQTITLVHAGGTEKVVEYLGIGGVPPRARVYWPTAGEYEVSPRTGRIVASRGSVGAKLRRWKVAPSDLKRVRKEWREFKASVDAATTDILVAMSSEENP